MASWVCLDSGIALKLVLKEADSQQAQTLWQTVVRTNQQPVAPQLFLFEITSVLRKHVYRGTITPEYGLLALERLTRLDISFPNPKDFHKKAWRLATKFNRPAAYDAHYLALAEGLGCEFWTADERLFNAVHEKLPRVRWLGDFSG